MAFKHDLYTGKLVLQSQGENRRTIRIPMKKAQMEKQLLRAYFKELLFPTF